MLPHHLFPQLTSLKPLLLFDILFSTCLIMFSCYNIKHFNKGRAHTHFLRLRLYVYIILICYFIYLPSITPLQRVRNSPFKVCLYHSFDLTRFTNPNRIILEYESNYVDPYLRNLYKYLYKIYDQS